MKKPRLAKKFIEELKLVPIVSAACEKVGIARNSVYRWRKEDPEFKKQMDEALDMGAESVSDLAESKLINNIKTGSMRAIEYWLNNNKKKYVKPRPKNFFETLNTNMKVNRIEFVNFSEEKTKKRPRKHRDD